jgi:F-type H+-transporting ATPase subunit epsilon
MAIPTKLTLEIVTSDRSLVREEVDEVELPGSEGYFGVLPGHTPLLSMLKVGELWYRVGQEKRYLAVAGGFVEVLPDRVTVLADIGERAEEIDLARAAAAKRRAEERIANPMDVDLERARFSLAKALVRIQVAAFARTRV